VDTGKYLKLLPHLHGTDGFFAAVFEKVNITSKTTEAKETALEANIHEATGTSKKKVVKIKVEKPTNIKPKIAKAKPTKESP
jgi:16S rRNA (cytosine967-C5)-methyltransferase